MKFPDQKNCLPGKIPVTQSIVFNLFSGQNCNFFSQHPAEKIAGTS